MCIQHLNSVKRSAAFGKLTVSVLRWGSVKGWSCKSGVSILSWLAGFCRLSVSVCSEVSSRIGDHLPEPGAKSGQLCHCGSQRGSRSGCTPDLVAEQALIRKVCRKPSLRGATTASSGSAALGAWPQWW